MSKQKQVEEAVSTAVNVPGAVAEVDGKGGTFYKLLVETPSPWEQVKMSPYDPMFWLSVNGQWVPRTLIEENRNRLVVNAEDWQMYLWGTASDLDFLHPDCFPKPLQEKAGPVFSPIAGPGPASKVYPVSGQETEQEDKS